MCCLQCLDAPDSIRGSTTLLIMIEHHESVAHEPREREFIFQINSNTNSKTQWNEVRYHSYSPASLCCTTVSVVRNKWDIKYANMWAFLLSLHVTLILRLKWYKNYKNRLRLTGVTVHTCVMAIIVSDYSCDFPRFNYFTNGIAKIFKSNRKSNSNVSNQIVTSQIELSKCFKSRFKYRSRLGFAHHCKYRLRGFHGPQCSCVSSFACWQ